MSKADALRLADYLSHIMDAISRIETYTGDMTEMAFLNSKLVQDAVIRNFEVIGEAARNIARHHPDFASLHADIPWNELYTMRNRVAHGYFAVDLELIWKTIERDLPLLFEQVRKI